MEKATFLENIKNYVGGSIDAKGYVIVGDNNIIVNIYSFADYKKLKAQLESLEKDLQEAQTAYQETPNTYISKQIESFYNKIEITQKEIESFEKEIVALANDLTKIPINTERLKKAQEYFLEGKQNEARAFLESEKDLMKQELKALLSKKGRLENETQENKNALINKSNEYLLLARLTSINFDLPDRIEKAKSYFKIALTSNRNLDNLFAYAYFLENNKFFNEAIEIYDEVLAEYRILSKTNFVIYSPFLATTLNNLANIFCTKNELFKAKEYYDECLHIYLNLSQNHSLEYAFLLANTFNNLGTLYYDLDEIDVAEKMYKEATNIFKKLSITNKSEYLYKLASSHNNLAILYTKNNQILRAEEEYKKTFEIYESLPNSIENQSFLSHILNNLAILYKKQDKLEKSEESHLQAFVIRRELVNKNPQVYYHELYQTLHNIANLHKLQNKLDISENEFQEALKIIRNLAKTNSQIYLQDVATVLNDFGLLNVAKYRQTNLQIDLQRAEEALQEALLLRKEKSGTNLVKIQFSIYQTLHNLGIVHKLKNELNRAEKVYQEALEIIRELYKQNPKIYSVELASLLYSISLFYLESVPNKLISVDYAMEVIKILLPFFNILPQTQEIAKGAVWVLNRWGVSFDDLFKD